MDPAQRMHALESAFRIELHQKQTVCIIFEEKVDKKSQISLNFSDISNFNQDSTNAGCAACVLQKDRVQTNHCSTCSAGYYPHSSPVSGRWEEIS